MLSRKAGLVGGFQAAAYILGFLSIALTLRLIDKTSFGLYGAAFAFVGTLSLLQSLGVNVAYAHHVARGDPEAEANGAALLLLVILDAIFLLVLGSAVGILQAGWIPGLSVPLHGPTLAFLAAAAALNPIRLLFETRLAGRGQVVRSALSGHADAAVVILAFPTVAIIWRVSNGLETPLAPWGRAWLEFLDVPGAVSPEAAAAGLGIAVLASRLLSILVGAALSARGWTGFRRPSGATLRRFIAYAAPVALAAVAMTAAANFDTLMVATFWGEFATADYRAAIQLAGPMSAAGALAALVLFHTIGREWAMTQSDHVRRLVMRADKYVLILAAPAAAFLIAFRAEIITFITVGNYESAAPILLVVALNTVFLNLLALNQNALLAIGRARDVGRWGAASGFLMVVGTVLLVPAAIFGIPLAGLGPVGAALAGLLFTTSYLAGMRLVLREVLGCPLLPPGTYRIGLVAGLTLVSLLWFKQMLGPTATDSVAKVSVWLAGHLLVFGWLLWLARVFDGDDIDLLRRTLGGAPKSSEAAGR